MNRRSAATIRRTPYAVPNHAQHQPRSRRLVFEEPLPRRPDVDEAFIAAVAAEFPIQGPRQLLPREAPPNVPHLIVQSTSSQVALSAVQADFEVRFYGDFPSDPDRCFQYVEAKLLALLEGLVGIGARPVVAGIVMTMTLSFQGEPDLEPVGYMLEHHVRPEPPPEETNDVRTQVGLRVADHYFITLALASYEWRNINRPVLPGMQGMIVRPWEGTVSDRGLELTVDVNNRLGAVLRHEYETVDADVLRSILGLARIAVEQSAVPYARDAILDTAAFAAAVA